MSIGFGQVGVGDVRTELNVTSLNNISMADAAAGAIVPLNQGSSYLPTTGYNDNLAGWRGYCHTCTTSCPMTSYVVGNQPRLVVLNVTGTSGVITYSGSGFGCLLENTLITLSSGHQIPICDISIGDNVLTIDNKINIIIDKKEIIVDKIYVFNDILFSSETHLHYIIDVNSNIILKRTSEVILGDSLLDINGEKIKIVSIGTIDGKFRVFDITTDGTHLFYANNILTHNKGHWCDAYVGDPYNSSGTLVGTIVFSCNSGNPSGTYNYTSGLNLWILMQSLTVNISCPVSSYTVYIDIYVDISTSGGGAISVCAASDSAVSINVGCSFYWEGDLYGTITDTLPINNGFSCNSATYYSSSFTPGENTTVFTFTGLWPTSHAGQFYSIRSTYITNSHPC